MPQVNLFFNTINISGHELQSAIMKVKKQNDRIAEIMKQTKVKMTPFMVHDIYEKIYGKAPITSIRRGMTELTELNVLDKLEQQKEEVYGAKNYYWQAR